MTEVAIDQQHPQHPHQLNKDDHIDQTGIQAFQTFYQEEQKQGKGKVKIVHLTKRIPCDNPSHVYDEWIRFIWKDEENKYKCRVVELGTDTSRGQANQCLRVVPGGIQEQIVSVGEPPSSSSSSAAGVVVVAAAAAAASNNENETHHPDLNNLIPSISYKVVAGPFPVLDHLAIVRFIMEPASSSSSSSTTLICWDVKYVPSTLGNIMCCGGLGIQFITRKYLENTLDDFSQLFVKEK